MTRLCKRNLEALMMSIALVKWKRKTLTKNRYQEIPNTKNKGEDEGGSGSGGESDDGSDGDDDRENHATMCI